MHRKRNYLPLRVDRLIGIFICIIDLEQCLLVDNLYSRTIPVIRSVKSTVKSIQRRKEIESYM